jgi:hypothetical protein
MVQGMSDLHPILPAGYNSWMINGDEVDGAGVNEPVSPLLFDTFVGLRVVILTEEMLEVFEGCADYTVPGQNNVVIFPNEVRTLVVQKRRA